MYEDTSVKNLHKLHGSVNWFIKKGSEDLYCYDEIFPRTLSHQGFFHIPFCVSEKANIPSDYLPLIIPPAMMKEYKIPVISKTWQDASKAFENADRIIFIGYSFPPTDTIMKFFLGTSLSNNQKGCRISIIDKHAERVMKALKEIFVNDICDNYIDLINIEFNQLYAHFSSSPTSFLDYLKN